MKIIGSTAALPPHIAKAYGVNIARPAVAGKIGAAASAAGASSPQTMMLGKAPSASPLVAAKVVQPVQFEASSASSPTAPGVFQMYTRAADKVEAAVAVQVGRTLDVKG